MSQSNNPFREALFDYLRKNFPEQYEVKAVIPDESILEDLYAAFDVNSFDEMFPNGQKDLDQAFKQAVFTRNPVLFSKNKKIDGIEILHKEEMKDPNRRVFLTKFYIEGFLQDKKLDRYLRNAIFHGKTVKADFSKLPPNVLQHMIESNDITGKELTVLCMVNQKMEQFCQRNDFEIFRLRLAKEFDVNYYESRYRAKYNPRELYLKYHSEFFRVSEFGNGFAIQYVHNAKDEGSSGDRIVSETWTERGLFDIILDEFDPRSFATVANGFFLIYDPVDPEKSASIFVHGYMVKAKYLNDDLINHLGTESSVIAADIRKELDKIASTAWFGTTGTLTVKGKKLNYIPFSLNIQTRWE